MKMAYEQNLYHHLETLSAYQGISQRKIASPKRHFYRKPYPPSERWIYGESDEQSHPAFGGSGDGEAGDLYPLFSLL